jgi:hypothetical protein
MRLRILSLVIVILIAALGYVAWNRNASPPAPGGSPGGSADANAPATGAAEPAMPPAAGGMPPGMATSPPAEDPGVVWERPKRWVEELASGMRLATYVIPAAPGVETATCAVYYFGPGQGGGTDANIERWVGEFENPGTPARRVQKMRGMEVTQVEVSGTYHAHAGMGGGGSETPSPGWTLLGAIVEGPNGALFFKLTGPSGTVGPAKKEFQALLASLKKK